MMILRVLQVDPKSRRGKRNEGWRKGNERREGIEGGKASTFSTSTPKGTNLFLIATGAAGAITGNGLEVITLPVPF